EIETWAFACDEHAQYTTRQNRDRGDEIEQIQSREEGHLVKSKMRGAEPHLTHQESGEQHDGGEMQIGEGRIHRSSKLSGVWALSAPHLRSRQQGWNHAPLCA